MEVKELRLGPVSYQDLTSSQSDRRSAGRVGITVQLQRYGFGFLTETRVRPADLERLYVQGAEVFRRWPEVLERCDRTKLGMLGPTPEGEEQHPTSPLKENKRFISLDADGKGWPDFIDGADSASRVIIQLLPIGVDVITAFERQIGHQEGFLSQELSTSRETHTTARLNWYPAGDGFSAEHTDTCVVTVLPWKPGLQIRVDGVWYELAGAKPGDIVINIGNSGSKYLAGDFRYSTWHRVRGCEDDRITFALFIHTRRSTRFPGTGENVYDWCTEQFKARGGTADVIVSKPVM
jgi:hypothetical protein